MAADTRAPLKSAWVALTAVSAEDQSFKEVTDANGHFVITGVPAGKYQFRAGKSGYVPGDYRLDGGPPKATLGLGPGEKLDKVEFQLSRTAVIMGRITDETGEPVAGVEMDALAVATRMGDWILKDPARVAVTNDLGEYRIYDLPPGGYYLSATDSGSGEFMTSFKWPEPGERHRNHLTIYYPGVIRSSEAQKIRLSAGQEMRIDFSLRTVKLLTISGRVLDADGKPAAQTKVMLRPQDPSPNPMLDLHDGISTDAQGDFVIKEVLPGSYVVSATLDEAEYWTEQRIEVAGDNVSGLVLQLSEQLELSGKVSATGGSKVDFHDLSIWLEPEGEEPSFRGAWAKIEKDGTFTIDKVRPTTHRLKVYPLPDGWYLSSAFFGKQNVLENGLKLADSDSGESLELTFSPGAGRIEGVVLLGGNRVHGALVRLFPEPANPYHTDLFQVVPTDEDGHFVINSVAPGRYRAVAFASETADGSRDDGSPPDASASASIVVAEKESKTVQLKLPKKEE